ncbi:MAG: asparagine synthase (glutamine-hydrolyzing), partial [Bacteroidota bacterium]|nr:asparagine synthase (glutamine-hydrolyzing) [Bacteroidota bacterium]
MCGITGYISLNNSIEPAQLKKATSLLQHRGPDAEGFYFSDNNKIGLGHRRLSILDLSTAANQPMHSSNGRYIIVFNGEVYNYKELAETLSDKGAGLTTTSDTEVILQLFCERGVDCFKELNGMFALAIYDIQKNILTLARDHAGIKPLFIYCDDDEFIFASELKAIQSIKKRELGINRKAIAYFLHLGFIPHPFTIYNKTEKFPAAHYLQLDINASNFNCINSQMLPFWSLEAKIEKETVKDEKTAKARLKNLLFDSVQKQLVSDVPIGTFLSGGIDSSLVTAIACQVSNKKINSYSIAID